MTDVESLFMCRLLLTLRDTMNTSVATSICGQFIVVSFSFNRAAQIILKILQEGQNTFENFV